MSVPASAQIREHFGQLTDPRVERTRRHALLDIIAIAICAVICGADSWVEVKQFGRDKETWLRTFLPLANGIPSHDTFGRLFARLDPDEFARGFRSWISTLAQLSAGEVVAIDGKQLRRSHDRALGKQAIHLVSAWASDNQLVLGQVKVDDKSNEITAIPQLLQWLALKGCMVTLDAMGCQRAIADQIVAQEADYLLALKGNQGHLLDDVRDIFQTAQAVQFTGVAHDTAQTTDKDHGRLETRRAWTISEPTELSYLRERAAWPHLRTLVMVEATRRLGQTRTTETRYYLCSQSVSATRALEVVRTHWHIENDLHWVLDVAFREDDCRIRQGHADQNFAILRHLALNLLKRDRATRIGIKAKRLKAAWSTDYLLHLFSL